MVHFASFRETELVGPAGQRNMKIWFYQVSCLSKLATVKKMQKANLPYQL